MPKHATLKAIETAKFILKVDDTRAVDESRNHVSVTAVT